MDSSELRAFIASQKILLTGEKNALENHLSEFTSLTDKGKSKKPNPSTPVSHGHDDTSGHTGDISLTGSQDNLSLFSGNNSELSQRSQHNIQKVYTNLESRDPLRPSLSSRKDQNILPDTNGATSKTGKENVLSWKPKCDREEQIRSLQEKFSVASFWDNFGTSAISKPQFSKTEENMVRVGEFSPANPHLQSLGKAHLGLGEYEERRRQLMDRKKQEYKDYLSQKRNLLLRTDHFHPSTLRLSDDTHQFQFNQQQISPKPSISSNAILADAATQTDLWLMQPTVVNSDSAVSVVPGNANGFINTDGFHLPAPSVDSPLPSLSPRVPRAHISQTTEQLPDARIRQLQFQEELRLQIEEKKRLEAERRERERLEEEALQRRVAEQQARLQAEYEREEQLRSEREKQKQQKMEDFQRRQEELKVEAELLKQEKRQRKLEAAELQGPQHSRLVHNANVVPHVEPTPISILKHSSPPPRSPRRAVSPVPSDHLMNSPVRLPEQLPQPPPPSPRALIKVLDGPTYPSSSRNLNDTLPIPLMPVAHTYAPAKYSSRSPRRSPSRGMPHSHKPANQPPSDAMQSLEDRWKIPAVQKNQCVREQVDANHSNSRSVLTQLGTFRRQLQMEHMRMEEKVRESQHHQYYQQHHFQRNPQQRTH